ncbi:MAG: PEGA domain-containing protein [bacterium]
MKKLLYLILPALIGCSKAQIPLAPQTDAMLKVTTIQPNGAPIDSAKVFVNDQLAGYTPFQQEGIPTGLLTLRVAKEGFQLYSEQVFINPEEKHSIEAVLVPLVSNEGELVVTIDQDSAMVLVTDSKGNTMGQSQERESVYVLSSGAYIVSGEKAGFSKEVVAVGIKGGTSTVVNLQLTPAASHTPPTLEFEIAEERVQLGEAISLSWQSDGYQVVIDQGVGTRGPNGSEKIICSSAGLKVFTATAYGTSNVTTQESDSVLVVPESVNLDFDVLPDSVDYGEVVPIQWNSDGYQVIIDQGVGTRGPSGYEEVSFENPGKKVFTATAYGQDNTLTTRKDSAFVRVAPQPMLPVLILSTTRLVKVDSSATISWYAQNADYVVVDYVDNADVQGTVSVSFSTPGIRIVTATAYNQAGYVSASDTIEVVIPEVVSVDDIIVPANTGVRADHGESGMINLNAGTFQVETPGKYQLIAEVWYNSGDSQLNESFYLQVRNDAGVVSGPLDANAGVYKVVPDDAGAPHMLSQRSGIFTLAPGTHTVELYHYAKIAHVYPQFLNGPIDGAESVKILGFRLVFVGN